MNIFWRSLVHPLLAALQPRTIVEVGCERGDNTRNFVAFCNASGAKLHVIDPAPQIPINDLHAWSNQPNFTLHRQKSLDVLPALPRLDAVLLDGDHNWYTVFHELKAIEEIAERTGCSPLVLLHDVGWPYGRRDMYYDPAGIPPDARQPYHAKGLRHCDEQHAWNEGMCHAVHEGGPGNGVLTAVEDFLRGAKGPYLWRIVPVYHGLGILCPAALGYVVQDLDRLIVEGGLLEQLERERLRLTASLHERSSPAMGDTEVLEWTLRTLTTSARWRIGNAVVGTTRKMLGMSAGEQVTDTLQQIIKDRKEQTDLLTAQAAAVSTDANTISEAFHHLYYANAKQTWRQTSWLGVPVWKCPLDLWVYQEILQETRPELIIETGTCMGGSALYLAGVCDQLGCGEIVSIDIEHRESRPAHPRIEYWLGDSVSPALVSRVAERARNVSRVMVILDSDHRCEHVLAELRNYAHLVGSGCYLIVEDTNVNGHPVFNQHGPGPKEAVDRFLAEDTDFAIDREREKFLLTFNPAGYLRKK